jgi:hypothetical protein
VARSERERESQAMKVRRRVKVEKARHMVVLFEAGLWSRKRHVIYVQHFVDEHELEIESARP